MTTQIYGVGAAVSAGTRTSSTGKESSDGSFASMMTASLSNQTEKVSNGKEMAAVTEPSKKAEPVKQEQPDRVEKLTEKKQVREEAKAPEKADEVTDAPKKLQETKETSKPEVPEDAEGLAEMAAKLLKQIKELMQDVLNLDGAELNQLMEQLGVTMLDLLNPQVLQQLVLEAAGGADFSVLLTDENAAAGLQQLLSGVQDILNQAGVTAEELQQIVTSEEFAQVLQSAEQTGAELAVLTQEQEAQVDNGSVKNQPVVNETDGQTAEVSGQEEDGFTVEVVKESSKGSENRQDMASDQSAAQNQPFAMTPVEQFVERMAQVSEGSFAELAPAEQIRDIANQLLEHIRVTIQPSQTSMEITLNPESIGKVNLNIMSKQGVMTAQFTTQTEAARIAIESQMSVLRENLQNQGLKVEAIEVTVSNFEFQQGNLNDTAANSSQQQNGRQSTRRDNLTLEEALSFDEVTEEESIALDMMERNGNQVDFKA